MADDELTEEQKAALLILEGTTGVADQKAVTQALTSANNHASRLGAGQAQATTDKPATPEVGS